VSSDEVDLPKAEVAEVSAASALYWTILCRLAGHQWHVVETSCWLLRSEAAPRWSQLPKDLFENPAGRWQISSPNLQQILGEVLESPGDAARVRLSDLLWTDAAFVPQTLRTERNLF